MYTTWEEIEEEVKKYPELKEQFERSMRLKKENEEMSEKFKELDNDFKKIDEDLKDFLSTF